MPKRAKKAAKNQKKAIERERRRREADAQAARALAAGKDPRYEDIREIHGSTIRLVRNRETRDELVAKTFDSREQFENEKRVLIRCEDDKGKEAIIQFKGQFEPGLVLYLEYAPGGSLKELLDEKPAGLDEVEVRNWASKALDILIYLHMHHDLAHLDFKAENMLLWGRHHNQLRGCDLESASKFGQRRSIYVSPYICPPELAEHIASGGGDGLRAAPPRTSGRWVSPSSTC